MKDLSLQPRTSPIKDENHDTVVTSTNITSPIETVIPNVTKTPTFTTTLTKEEIAAEDESRDSVGE